SRSRADGAHRARAPSDAGDEAAREGAVVVLRAARDARAAQEAVDVGADRLDRGAAARWAVVEGARRQRAVPRGAAQARAGPLAGGRAPGRRARPRLAAAVDVAAFRANIGCCCPFRGRNGFDGGVLERRSRAEGLDDLVNPIGTYKRER